jgi:peptidoglycan/LPS O-acetylase OafA/YrhL
MVTDTPTNSARSAQGPVASSGQLPSLTALRGVAAFWVVIYHYSVQCLPNLDAAPYTYLVHKGYLAVDMFFMLSGFVMTHVYHRAFSESVTRIYRSFLFARVARIYPLHLLILVLFVATAIAAQLTAGARIDSLRNVPLQGSESVSAFVANVLMLQGLDAGQLSWNYPSWSISVEFMAYLLFPFALPAIWRASDKAKIAMTFFIFALLGLLAFLTQGNFDQWDGPITLLRCLPEFILGTLLYCAFRAVPRGSFLDRGATAFGVLLMIVLCLHAGAPDLLIAGLFAVLILTAVLNTGSFAAIANTPSLIWLGDISYSLYLVHGFVQFLTTKLLGHVGIEDHGDLSIYSSLVVMVLMIATSLAVSHLTYFGVEIGCRQYLRNLFGVRRKSKSIPQKGQLVPVMSGRRRPMRRGDSYRE